MVALAARPAAVTGVEAHELFVQPLSAAPMVEPAGGPASWPGHGSTCSTGPSSELPWAAAGALLARLHLTPQSRIEGVPAVARRGQSGLASAVRRVESLPVGTTDLSNPHRCSARVSSPEPVVRPDGIRRRSSTATGTWAAARPRAGWRLLDVDDLGTGDPAWDLGRSAGFWAAGLLDDLDWHDFLDGYRASGGARRRRRRGPLAAAGPRGAVRRLRRDRARAGPPADSQRAPSGRAVAGVRADVRMGP